VLDVADDRIDLGDHGLSPQQLVRYILNILLRRWRYVFYIPILAIVFTCVLLAKMEPRYRSTAEILLVDPTAQNLGQGSPTPTYIGDSATVESEIHLLQSQSLALRVVREFHLDSNPEFAEFSNAQRLSPNVDDQLYAVADALQKRIQVIRLQSSYVLAVSVTAHDPKTAQRLTDSVVNYYLDDQRQNRKDALEQAKGWWTQRLDFPDVSGRIITVASLPEVPSFPNWKMSILIVACLSTIIGVGTAVLIEIFDDRIRTLATTERIVDSPVLGMIPLVKEGDQLINIQALVNQLTCAPQSHFSEVIRTAHVILRSRGLGTDKKVLLVTSALSGEGKSAAALLIAVSNALLGEKTALVDCDFRHRSITSQFGGGGQGWNEVVAGTADLATVTVKEDSSGVYVIPVGRSGDSANALLGQPMRNLLTRLRTEYDFVVMDAAPILGVVDALALAALADDTLLVVEWGRTTKASVLEGLKAVRAGGHRVTAAILNKVDYGRLRNYDESYAASSYALCDGVAEACYDGW
jgi:capsular exopolysaccharide synthesis family protein